MTAEESFVREKKAVCPESTIESAAERNPIRRRRDVPPVSITRNEKDTSKGETKLTCESTIESSFRRDFIKKAALITAGVAVGSTLLGSKIIPESSASSCTKGSSVHPDSHVLYCCPTGTAIWGATCSGTGVFGHARTSGIGVSGASSYSYGVKGCSSYSVGVYGHSCCCVGVAGSSSQYIGVYGKSSSGYGVEGYSPKNVGVYGQSCCSAGVIGSSSKYVGVYGESTCDIGVIGYSPKYVGIYGKSCCYCGVQGYSPKNAGVAGSSCCYYGVLGYSPKNAGVYGESSCSTGVSGHSTKYVGVAGSSSCGYGVWGYSPKSVGVLAQSCTNLALQATASNHLIGQFKNYAPSGDRTALIQFETGDTTAQDWNVGAAGGCNSLQVPDGSFYVQYANPSTNSPALVVNKSGQVGVGKPFVPSYGICTPGLLSVVVPSSEKLCSAVLGQNCFALGCCCAVAGVIGFVPATKGYGIGGYFIADSNKGRGVEAFATATSGPTFGGFFQSFSTCGVGSQGAANASGGIGLRGLAGNPGAIPIVAKGASCQSANLQQWRNSSCKPLSIVNPCGWLGVGAATTPTTLTVGGSMSAKVAKPSTAYTMGKTDFSVLANAASGAFNITLPAANTATGMLVFIKKVDSSANIVNVNAAGSDLIEGESSQSLSVEFASLYLISDGVSNWYMIANENVDSSYGRA